MRCNRDEGQFFEMYSIEETPKFAQHPERIVTGTAPSLYTLSKMFPGNPHIKWLMTQIIALSEFSGAKVKVTPFQARRLAYHIFSDYSFLKVTEIMLFFDKLETGRYGKLDWGTFDPVNILSKLPLFMQDRQELFRLAEQEELEAKMEQWKKEAVPPPPHIVQHLKDFSLRISQQSNKKTSGDSWLERLANTSKR